MARTKIMKKGKTTVVKKAPVQRKTKWNDVHHEQQFFVNDGNVLKNFTELPKALRNMNQETFAHHVNDEKHDFANWVHDVMGAKTLAKQMRSATTRTALIRTIKTKL